MLNSFLGYEKHIASKSTIKRYINVPETKLDFTRKHLKEPAEFGGVKGGKHDPVQMDNDPKQSAKATKKDILQCSSTDLMFSMQTEHAFHLLKTNPKAERSTNKHLMRGNSIWSAL